MTTVLGRLSQTGFPFFFPMYDKSVSCFGDSIGVSDSNVMVLCGCGRKGICMCL